MGQTRMASLCATSAITLYLTISANLLTLAGIPYVEAGGSLLIKIHPALYPAILAAGATLWQRIWTIDQQLRCKVDPLLITFFFCSATAGFFDIVTTGGSSLILLIDNFLPAGLIAITFADAVPADRERMATLTRALLVVNAMLGIGEAIDQQHLIPLYLNDLSYHESPGNFRPTALYDHPLTGAIATVIALGMGPRPGSTRIIRLATYTVLITALIAFASRAAILIWIFGHVIGRIFRWPSLYRSSTPWLVGGLAAICLVSTVIMTPIGERLASHAYWDASADVRLRQLDILERLDWQSVFFGLDRHDLTIELHRLDLRESVSVIECFPLLVMIDFGLIGGSFVIIGFMALLAWCWRRSDKSRRFMLIAVVLIASGSNSLGRKCMILPLLVTATIASSTQEAVAQTRKQQALLPSALFDLHLEIAATGASSYGSRKSASTGIPDNLSTD